MKKWQKKGGKQNPKQCLKHLAPVVADVVRQVSPTSGDFPSVAQLLLSVDARTKNLVQSLNGVAVWYVVYAARVVALVAKTSNATHLVVLIADSGATDDDRRQIRIAAQAPECYMRQDGPIRAISVGNDVLGCENVIGPGFVVFSNGDMSAVGVHQSYYPLISRIMESVKGARG